LSIRIRPVTLATLCLLSGTAAQASSQLVQSSLGSNLYLSSNTSASFDIHSVLTQQGSYNAPYQIGAASVTFLFTDDSDTELIRTIHTLSNYTPTTVTSRVDNSVYVNPAEAASVQIGTQSASGASSLYSVASHLDHITIDWHYIGNNCYYSYCPTLFEGSTHYWQSESGYGGEFAVSFSLNAANLASLSNTGVLNFALGVTGDLTLKSASLNFDVDANPSPAPVPEPGSYALMLAGLGGMGFLARRQRR